MRQCNGVNVLEFLRYLDSFGKTGVAAATLHPVPASPPSASPLRFETDEAKVLAART
jgi:hypothetical protein